MKFYINIFSALISWRKEEALSVIMDALNKGITIKELYLNVFQPAQYELGRLLADRRKEMWPESITELH
ncbi:MAG: hypothetical protein U5N58_07825 [Actinomycetota bacterium]|nr:hypothetical protein [Actinomycetota bacterium]